MNYLLGKCGNFIHVGAHKCEEAPGYGKKREVLWVEAIPQLASDNKKRLELYPNQMCVQAVMSDVDDVTKTFHISGQTPRSSYMEFTNFHHRDPKFSHSGDIELKTKRLDTLLKEMNYEPGHFDGITTDCQGADLDVLKGMGEYLDHVNGACIEIMHEERYKNQPLAKDIRKFMKDKGFLLWHTNGCDDYYVRPKLLKETAKKVLLQKQQKGLVVL